jgi:5-methylcytosine-specific restriction protein A
VIRQEADSAAICLPGGVGAGRSVPQAQSDLLPTAEQFREELMRMMREGLRNDVGYVDVNAGELHRRVGDYPGPNHRMPNCCQVMRAAMGQDAGDRILQQPAGGDGATLTIRYVLPRLI